MLKVEYVSPQELRTYENNAKEHPAEQVEQIKKSIQEFGFNDPIAVWKDNVIIEGHGRLIAALELGLEEVPIIRLDDLTDDQRKAYALAHNKLTMNSGFNMDLLYQELDDIEIDMTDYGFNTNLDQYIDSFFEPEEERKEVQFEFVSFTMRVPIEKQEEAEELFADAGYNFKVVGK